ncbi:MAG: IclR family transcriptional regulator [Deltaproteobacteria bacterium]|nr:IclR family transcriptional regulator [Deltaproteobacteria bacterium]
MEKGFSLLEFLTDHPNLTVTEMARGLKIDRSTCNRFLLTLKSLGYIAAENHGRYRPTLKIFELGNRVADIVEIRPLARRCMEKLANIYGETVNLGRLDGNDVVTIDVVSSQESIRFDASIGSRSPVYTLAMGKAILAFRSEEEQADYLKTCEFKPLTPKTIKNRKSFRKELLKVRGNGYAVDNQEWALDTRCVAVPIFDFSAFPSHAISISGPAMRMTHAKTSQLIPELIEAGKYLSKELGAVDNL